MQSSQKELPTDREFENNSSIQPAGWQKLLVLIQESLGLLKNLVELMGLEFLAALQAIPKLIALSLGLLFVFTLTWISFCLCLSWLAYWIVGNVGAAFFCFFLIHLLALCALVLLFKHYKNQLTFANSRAHMNEIAEVIREACKSYSAKENGRD